MKLSLYNSLSRQKEEFTPIDTELVKMYVCGPTVYDHPHIGNARSVVVYDILYRILIEIFGFEKVRYVRNITDIDDKIIVRAREEGVPVAELTKKTTDYFHDDMDYLGCLRPNIEPKATDHLEEMIFIIQRLLEEGFAYQAEGHVYFDVTKAPHYNELSGRSFDDMLQEVRIDNSSGKRNPADFVLWKPAHADDDISAKFTSPFNDKASEGEGGYGRPGWHIECSAMSYKYLGETFDIHGGGADLIFPHHTNEIAQSCCAFPGSEYAKLWVHNGFLTVNQEKMSKSLGNFTTVYDLRNKGIKGEVARLFLLSNHYRKPIDYNDKAISDAQQMINYWYRAIEDMDSEVIESRIKKENLPAEFFAYLLDDMNISAAIRVTNEFAKDIHSGSSDNKKEEIAVKLVICARFLGLMQQSAKEWFKGKKGRDKGDNNDIEIEKLIEQRLAAKKQKDWQLADSIRDKLKDMGIEIEDKPGGTCRWYRTH